MSDPPPSTEQSQVLSDNEAETLALAAAEAIKRLVRERQVLRDQFAAQAHETQRLREHVAVLRDNYRKLANELIAQLKLVDQLDAKPESPASATQLHWLHAEQQKWSGS
jgi:septal ring factor EnvC (AmiA/AmiB activator)